MKGRKLKASILALTTLFFQETPARAELIMSQMGGVCIDAEGGGYDGARLIGYPCHGGANQNFEFVNGVNTRMRLVGSNLCATSDRRSKGSEVRLRTCDYSASGNSVQNFAPWSGYLIGHNTGYVMDLAGGWSGRIMSTFSRSLQPIVLWSQHGGENQRWAFGYPQRYSSWAQVPEGSYFSAPGKKGLFQKKGNAVLDIASGQLIGVDAGTLIGVDAGTLIGVDAGTLIAAGGLNIR